MKGWRVVVAQAVQAIRLAVATASQNDRGTLAADLRALATELERGRPSK